MNHPGKSREKPVLARIHFQIGNHFSYPEYNIYLYE